MRVRQFTQARGQVGGYNTEAGLQAYGLVQHLNGLSVLAAIFQHLTQRECRFCHCGMSWRPVPLRHFQALARKLFGFIQTRLRGAQKTQRHQALCDFRTVCSEDRSALLDGQMQQGIRAIKFSELLVDATQVLVELGLNFRVAVE
jgi:hypothetical protein